MEMRKLGYSNGQYAEDAQKPILMNYPTGASVEQALSRGIDDLVVHMEKEDLKQARYMGDLDFHVNQLQMRIQAESYKVRGVGWIGGEKGSREGAEAERGAEREGGE